MPENRDIERRNSDEIERRQDSLVRKLSEYLEEFEEQGLANVEEPDLDGWNLHRAARENRVDIARALIARGADVNARNGYDADATPLHITVQENSIDVARLLIEHGAEFEMWDYNGNTPLDWAAFANSRDIGRLLIEHGADLMDVVVWRDWMDGQEDGS